MITKSFYISIIYFHETTCNPVMIFLITYFLFDLCNVLFIIAFGTTSGSTLRGGASRWTWFGASPGDICEGSAIHAPLFYRPSIH